MQTQTIERSEKQRIDDEGIKLARLARGFNESEGKAVGEVLAYALRNKVHSSRVEFWFIEAGYPVPQARQYASKIRRIKGNKQLRAKVEAGEQTFNSAIEQNREMRKDRFDRKRQYLQEEGRAIRSAKSLNYTLEYHLRMAEEIWHSYDNKS